MAGWECGALIKTSATMCFRLRPAPSRCCRVIPLTPLLSCWLKLQQRPLANESFSRDWLVPEPSCRSTCRCLLCARFSLIPDRHVLPTDKPGKSLLHEAAAFGLHHLTAQLVSKGLDVNGVDPVNGWTPVHYACHNGCGLPIISLHLSIVLAAVQCDMSP